MSKKLLQLSDYLKELKKKKSETENKLQDIKDDIDIVQKEMIEIMTTEELSNFNRYGTTFSLVLKEYPSAVIERKAELYDRMKEKGFEHLFSINAQTLSATINELISNNEGVLPWWLDGLIKMAEKATIRVTKSKK